MDFDADGKGKLHALALVAALILGNVSLALGPWLVRLADTGPVSAAFWRLLLAVPVLIVIARAAGQRLGGIQRRSMLFVALGSGAFALDLASWHIGIELTRLANATLFGNSGSIVLLIWGFIAARMLPRGNEWLAICLALAGAAILMGRSLDISAQTLIGDVFCLAAGMLYAVYLLTFQSARARYGGWSLLVWVSVFGCPVLLAIAWFLGEPIWPENWGPVIALSVTGQLLGQGLLVFSLRHFPPLVIGLALLTQPALAAVIGYALFGEVLIGLDILGMAMLGMALVMSRVGQGRSVASTHKPQGASHPPPIGET